jgi:tight adherence protein C
MMTMLWGAGIGLSLIGLVVGLRPARPSLAQAHQILTQQADALPAIVPVAAPPRSLRIRLLGPVARILDHLGMPRKTLRSDLELAGMDVETFLARKVFCGVVGLFLPMIGQAVFLLVGVMLPPILLVVVGLVCGVVLFFIPDGEARSLAATRRVEARQALDQLMSFAATSMAAGDGIEAAFEGATTIGTGVVFAEFRQAGVRARMSRRPIWETYGDLARSLGLTELDELAATIELASGEGARIAESLAAKAESLRGRVSADRLAANVSTTEKMQIPVGLMLVGFLSVLSFPAVFKLLTSM